MAGRIELKYLIDHRTKARLQAVWRPYLEPAPYTDDRSMYPILSLYYDSPSWRFYDEKLEGEGLRSKVRVRGYGFDWSRMDPCFLEVKSKVANRIFKLRRNLGPFKTSHWEPRSWGLDDDPKAAPLAALVHRYRLRPAVQVLYQREAYESPFCRGLRVAFDSQLLALFPGEQMRDKLFNDPQRRCLGETQFVFEIKSNGGLPAWVTDAIATCQLQQRSISKYVAGVERLGLQHREMGVYA